MVRTRSAQGPPASSSDSRPHSPVRYPTVSDDRSPARPDPRPPSPPPVTGPARRRMTPRIRTGRYPAHQLASRDLPRFEHGESSHQANHGQGTTPPPMGHVYSPATYQPPVLPPQPISSYELSERLVSMRSGYQENRAGLRSLTERVKELDMSFIYWRDRLDEESQKTNDAVQRHHVDEMRELVRMRRLVYVFGGIAVLAVLMSVLPYLFPRH